MKKTTSLISPAFAQAAQQALQSHAPAVDGLQIALLATPDGFEVACLRNRSELQAGRLAAMASSLMAMGRAVGKEIQSPACKRLTFEAMGSTVVFQAIEASQPCILCLVLGPNAILGRALWAASGVEQALSTC